MCGAVQILTPSRGYVSGMNPNDMLVWPDGFWCFREEHCDEFLRNDDYRIVAHNSEEWHALHLKGPLPPPPK